jgi:tetratricopeptide (TPR) repeat protein
MTHEQVQAQDQEPKYYGLMQLCVMSSAQATEMENAQKRTGRNNKRAIIEKYKFSMEIHPSYAQELAIYFELNHFPKADVEKYYRIAIDYDDTAVPHCNLADYYKKEKDYPNMIQCLQDAIRTYKDDIYSMVTLALYYAGKRDTDTAQMYYEMALTHHKAETVFEFDTLVEMIELVYMIDFIQDEGWNQTNAIYLNLKRQYLDHKEIRVYQNKVRLFHSLNHTTECGICFNVALHIDFHCGHCVCKDCYLRLTNQPCPFCRH